MPQRNPWQDWPIIQRVSKRISQIISHERNVLGCLGENVVFFRPHIVHSTEVSSRLRLPFILSNFHLDIDCERLVAATPLDWLKVSNDGRESPDLVPLVFEANWCLGLARDEGSSMIGADKGSRWM
jgi:hypothetical protein